MKLEQERVIHKSRDEFGELMITDGSYFRTLYFGNRDKQSCMLIGQPDVLVLKYTQIMASALIFGRFPSRILVMGLGGGSLPKFFMRACPEAKIDVLESRLAVIKLAHGYFEVPENEPRLRIFHEDGEHFIQNLAEDRYYNLMFVDIFDSLGPAEAISNREFLKTCYRHLSDEGVLCINFWNRSVDGFERKFRLIKKLFKGDEIFRIVLEKINSNVLVYVVKKRSGLGSFLESLSERARELEDELGIKSTEHLRFMSEQNRIF